MELRRGDHSGARLKMEQAQLERLREKTEEEVVAHFQRRLNNPEVRDLICQAWISPEEREARIREIFGRPPEPPEAAAAASGSNPVKPSQTESNPIQPNPTKSNQMKTRLNRASNHGRVTPHGERPAHRVTSLQKMMAKYIAIKNERKTMHLLLFTPVLGSAIWIGGGGLGLVLLIVILVLIFR